MSDDQVIISQALAKKRLLRTGYVRSASANGDIYVKLLVRF